MDAIFVSGHVRGTGPSDGVFVGAHAAENVPHLPPGATAVNGAMLIIDDSLVTVANEGKTFKKTKNSKCISI